MPGHKGPKLVSALAVQSAIAITQACPDLFCGAVRERAQSENIPWREAAAAEYLDLLKHLKSDRDLALGQSIADV